MRRLVVTALVSVALASCGSAPEATSAPSIVTTQITVTATNSPTMSTVAPALTASGVTPPPVVVESPPAAPPPSTADPNTFVDDTSDIPILAIPLPSTTLDPSAPSTVVVTIPGSAPCPSRPPFHATTMPAGFSDALRPGSGGMITITDPNTSATIPIGPIDPGIVHYRGEAGRYIDIVRGTGGYATPRTVPIPAFDSTAALAEIEDGYLVLLFTQTCGDYSILAYGISRGQVEAFVAGLQIGEEPNAAPLPRSAPLTTHCGIVGTFIDGNWWNAEPGQADGGNPPAGWDNPTQWGTLTFFDEDTAVFSTDTGMSATFVRTELTEPPLHCK